MAAKRPEYALTMLHDPAGLGPSAGKSLGVGRVRPQCGGYYGENSGGGQYRTLGRPSITCRLTHRSRGLFGSHRHGGIRSSHATDS